MADTFDKYTPATPDESLEIAFNRIVRDSISPVTLGLGILYLVYTVSHWLILPSNVRVPMSVIAALSGGSLLGTYRILKGSNLPPQWAHPVATVVSLIVLLNSCLHMVLTDDIRQTTNLILLIIGLAVFLLAWRWLALIIGIIWIVWIAAISQMTPSDDFVHYEFGLFAATGLAVVFHIVRVRTLRRLEGLRIQEIQNRFGLEAANIEVQQSEERFRKLAEATFEGIVVHEQGQILDVNQACLDMFGYEYHEIIGRSVLDFANPPSRETVMARISEDDEQAYEANAVKKDGTIFLVETRARNLTFQGRKVRVSALRDITERKHIEKEREQLIQELDAFAHTVAHNLKNPLNPILGYSEMLLNSIDDLSPEMRERSLKTMVYSANHMVNIIDALLLLARMRQVEIQIVPLDMEKILEKVQQRLAYMIEENHADITLPKAWPQAVGYVPWVEEVWASYLSNAIKYGGNPLHIELGASEQGNGTIQFWVKDNGDGIMPEKQAQLFTPFTRVHLVEDEGHGLGLSIVQRIVERLGGTVGVESVLGQGSTFYFTLPSNRD